MQSGPEARIIFNLYLPQLKLPPQLALLGGFAFVKMRARHGDVRLESAQIHILTLLNICFFLGLTFSLVSVGSICGFCLPNLAEVGEKSL